jgi:hypothetical protein
MMPNATYPCAKRDCSAPGNILCAGNHKCCVCKKPVHAAFCSCGEHEYDAIATKLSYAASGLLLAYRKVERNKVAKKQGKQPRQAALLPFLKKTPN